MIACHARLARAAWGLLALAGCGRVIGLEDGYYLAPVDSGGGGSTAEAGRAGAGTAGLAETSGGASTGGTGGAGGTPSAGGEGGDGPAFAMPPGKLVFERYTSYVKGDSQMYVVTFPGGKMGPELGQAYGLCSLFNGIFSPDGRYLVVGAVPASVCPTAGLDRTELEIYILDLDNLTPQGKQRVTDNDKPDEDPQYAPDGHSILFKHDGHLARWVVGSTPFNETCTDMGSPSFCFNHGTGTTLQQSKPVIDETGYVCYESSLNQNDPNGDIYCFDLAVGLANKDITLGDNVTVLAGHTNVYDSRPVMASPYLYYTRWSMPGTSKVNQIWRRNYKKLSEKEELAKFCVDAGVGYEDAFSVGEGDLVVFSSNANSVGKSDLFVGDFRSTESVSLNELVPQGMEINTQQEELGAAFWHAPPAAP